MKDELQNYMGRPKRYDNIDGTGEMGMGVMMLGFALLGYLQAVLPRIRCGDRLRQHVAYYPVLMPMLGCPYTGVAKPSRSTSLGRVPDMSPTAVRGKSWWIAMVAFAAFAAVWRPVLGCLMCSKGGTIAMSLPRMGNLAIWWRRTRSGSSHGGGTPWKWLVVALHGAGASRDWSRRPRGLIGRCGCGFCSLASRGSHPVRATLICTFGTHNRPPRKQNERATSSHFRTGPGHS